MAKKTKKKPTPKSNKVSLKQVLFIGAAVVVIGATFVLGNYNRTKTSPEVEPPEVLRAITEDVQGKYANLAVNDSPWPAQMGSQQALRDEGYEFSVSAQSMPTIYITMTESPDPESGKTFADSPEAVHDIIALHMKRTGFRTDKLDRKLPMVVYWGGDEEICLEQYDTQQVVLTFTCYGMKDIAEQSQKAQPFVSAYNAANPTSPIGATSIVGPIVIKSQYGAGVIGSSHAAGYDIAEAVVTTGKTKKLVLFYNKLDGPWRYITQADDEFGFKCSDFRVNDEVRTAMHNQICLDTSGHVRLDTANRALQ